LDYSEDYVSDVAKQFYHHGSDAKLSNKLDEITDRLEIINNLNNYNDPTLNFNPYKSFISEFPYPT